MKQKLLTILNDHFNREVVVEKPKDKSFGHFATPIAFSLAKELRRSPMQIADELCTAFNGNDMFESVDAIKGYLNFRLSAKFLDEYASWALSHEEQFGAQEKNESILLEFVSANPTGPLHIGHARGAVFGDILLRLGRHLGYKMSAEYYVNDAGNQIDLLGLSLALEGQSSLLNQHVDWPEKYYRGEYLDTLAKDAAKKFGSEIFNDETRYKELALWAKDRVLELIVSDMSDANIKFDTYVSEASLYNQTDLVMKQLKDNGALEEIDGKLWLKSSEHGDEKDRVVIREDGRATYLAGDIIYHNQKFERGFDHYINIWGADHHGYIARVKASIKLLGYNQNKLEVLLSQMVSLLKDGQPYKMSKRAGNVILMSDIVDEIGADALRFIFASKKSDTALEFDVEDLKKQDSSNPVFYINYAHARIFTLIAKSQFTTEQIEAQDLKELSETEANLLFEALLLPEVLDDAFHSRGVQKLSDYLKALASGMHRFYAENKIIGSENELRYLKLFTVVALSIRVGLNIMGIKALERM